MPDDLARADSYIHELERPLSVDESGTKRPAISIVGLGYVGAVSAACFAAMGHYVIGVDLDLGKVCAIREGRAPLVEDGLGDLIGSGVQAGVLTACAELEDAIAVSEITFICVGTPSEACGKTNLSALRRVAHAIGCALANRAGGYHTVVVRSTVPASTTRQVLLPIVEAASGLRCGDAFGLCVQPEFLREGTAIKDFFDPPKTVVGGFDDRSIATVAALYSQIEAPLICTSLEVAEMVKQVDNTWHALKVAFGNEVGRLSKQLGFDSHEIMGIFTQDTKLNISSTYLKPGFAFGGSCLPKDVRSICHIAGEHGISVPLMQSLLPSNDAQIQHALRLVDQTKACRVGVLGLTFKNGTDDLRESPQIDLIGQLLSRADAPEIRLFDANVTSHGVSLAAAHSEAANPEVRMALQALPSLMAPNAGDLVEWADVVVVAHATEEFANTLRRRTSEPKQILDLVRLPPDLRQSSGYIGLCW